MEPKRFYEVLFRGIFAAFPKMESVAMNCNDTCKTKIGDDITKSAKYTVLTLYITECQ